MGCQQTQSEDNVVIKNKTEKKEIYSETTRIPTNLITTTIENLFVQAYKVGVCQEGSIQINTTGVHKLTFFGKEFIFRLHMEEDKLYSLQVNDSGASIKIKPLSSDYESYFYKQENITFKVKTQHSIIEMKNETNKSPGN